MNQWLEHKYGDQVHILNDSYLSTLLTKLCLPDTFQPTVQYLVEDLFSRMATVAFNRELKKVKIVTSTRMTAIHKDKKLTAEIIDPTQKVFTASLARAGNPASQIVFNLLNHIIDPGNVRQDHIWASRMTDLKRQVTGTDFGGTKIGGTVKNATVFIPDPMGATGNTITSTVDLYKKSFDGKKSRYIALHLIITPEFIKTVLDAHPDVQIYALRLDRGLSSPEILKSIPGTHWRKEKGLNEHQYIVPGAGGLGEVLNNSFV